MNVLLVIHYPVFGGPHNQAVLLASSLAERGVSMTVLLPDDHSSNGGSAVARLRGGGLDVVTRPLNRARATLDPRHQLAFFFDLPRDVRAIRKVIRTRKIDIVQVGGLVNPQGAIAARLEDVPVIWQLLDTRAPMVVRRLLMPLVLGLSDIVMSTGHAVAAVHPGADRRAEQLRVFFPPVDSDHFRTDRVDRIAARRDFGFSPRDHVLGTVGNLNPQKGHEYFLRAAAETRRRAENVKVLIVGASHDTHRAYERDLYELCRELEMSVGRDVVFAGGLSDVRPALAAMDIFVLASVPRSEGAPTAVGEAMMMKLPVVATDVGSVREMIDDGETGFIVPAEDARALADALLWILENPRACQDFGSRARERAVSRFSAEECARVHLAAYEYVLSRGKRSRRNRALA
jgi:glycosyltransferase involved in cell wall biosynthesis